MYRTRMARLITQIRRPHSAPEVWNILREKVTVLGTDVKPKVETSVSSFEDLKCTPKCSTTTVENTINVRPTPLSPRLPKPAANEQSRTRSPVKKENTQGGTLASTLTTPPVEDGPPYERFKTEPRDSNLTDSARIGKSLDKVCLWERKDRPHSASPGASMHTTPLIEGPSSKRLKSETYAVPRDPTTTDTARGSERPDKLCFSNRKDRSQSALPGAVPTHEACIGRTETPLCLSDDIQKIPLNSKTDGLHEIEQSNITYFWERSAELKCPIPDSATELKPHTSVKRDHRSICHIPETIQKTQSKAQVSSTRNASRLANNVVASLSPYYAKGYFESKEIFKIVAKQLTRHLLRLTQMDSEDVGRIKAVVKSLVSSCKRRPITGVGDLNWDAIQ